MDLDSNDKVIGNLREEINNKRNKYKYEQKRR